METFELPDPLPKFWEHLNEKDQREYAFLRKALSAPTCKNRRNRSNQTFTEIIEAIKGYVVQENENDAKRSLVCGICWLQNSIAINTRQLRLLISKCKSSINGSFQNLGYGTLPAGADSATSLIKVFPHLKCNFPELRQWTIRQKVSQTPEPSMLVEYFHNQRKNQQQAQINKTEYISPAPSLEIDQNDDCSLSLFSFQPDPLKDFQSEPPKQINDDDHMFVTANTDTPNIFNDSMAMLDWDFF